MNNSSQARKKDYLIEEYNHVMIEQNLLKIEDRRLLLEQEKILAEQAVLKIEFDKTKAQLKYLEGIGNIISIPSEMVTLGKEVNYLSENIIMLNRKISFSRTRLNQTARKIKIKFLLLKFISNEEKKHRLIAEINYLGREQNYLTTNVIKLVKELILLFAKGNPLLKKGNELLNKELQYLKYPRSG